MQHQLCYVYIAAESPFAAAVAEFFLIRVLGHGTLS